MSKTKHTPGPWNAEVRGGYSFVEPKIAKMKNRIPQTQEVANARLIAAAPALLEALKLSVKTEERYYDGEETESGWFRLARAAIAKAEGNND